MNTTLQGSGIYFDGIIAIPHSVSLTLENTAIGIASADGVVRTRWPYADIDERPSSPGRLRLGLCNRLAAARINVSDPAFAAAVRQRLGLDSTETKTTERRRRMRIVKWTIAALLAVFAVGVTGMPALTRLLLPLVPVSAEVPMGFQAHLEEKQKSADKNTRFECGDAGEQERAGKTVFLQLVQRLEKVAGLPYPLHAFIVASDEVNAYALPGGYVYVNAGLFKYLQSADEFAGILGHEIGHVAHRDSVRGALHSAGLSFLFGMVFGDVFGIRGVSLAAVRLLDQKHTRAQEAAADAFGAQLINKLGADPHAVARVFERMRSGHQSRDPVLLSDHPTDAARIAAIRAIPAVANPKPVLTDEEWEILRGVCSGG